PEPRSSPLVVKPELSCQVGNTECAAGRKKRHTTSAGSARSKGSSTNPGPEALFLGARRESMFGTVWQELIAQVLTWLGNPGGILPMSTDTGSQIDPFGNH